MGYLLLEGGAEFGGGMSEPDLRAIELAGGPAAAIAILPTAAAPDNNHVRAGNHGIRWFRSLGAAHIDLVPVIDTASASDPALAQRIRSARFIYLPGGFPRHLGETLANSLAGQAMLEAHAAGAVIGGSSAGAMVLCGHYYDPDAGRLLPGLNFLPDSCVLPHHNTFGRGWAGRLAAQLPGTTLIGIDERTGMLNDLSAAWTVYGPGKVTLYRNGQVEVHARGETFQLSKDQTSP